jgi:DNA-binding Xre family transcriptional regulator
MFYFYLDVALNELGITKNKLSVESKVRSNTIIDLAKGNVSRLDFFSLQAILDTLNLIAEQKGIDRKFDMNDIVRYDYKGDVGKHYIKIGDTEST